MLFKPALPVISASLLPAAFRAAAQAGLPEVVRALLNMSRVRPQVLEGAAADAICRGHAAVVEILLEQGAQLTVRVRWRALRLALSTGCCEGAEMALRHDAAGTVRRFKELEEEGTANSSAFAKLLRARASNFAQHQARAVGFDAPEGLLHAVLCSAGVCSKLFRACHVLHCSAANKPARTDVVAGRGGQPCGPLG